MTHEHDPWGDLADMPLAGLLAAIEAYQFLDALGHPLSGCAEFQALVTRVGEAVEASHAV